MAIITSEIYCVLEEAEGLLARQVLEGLPLNSSSSSVSGIDYSPLYLYDKYQANPTPENPYNWTLIEETTNKDGIYTPIKYDNADTYLWFYPDEFAVLGFTASADSNYRNWLQEHGIFPDGISSSFTFPIEPEKYFRYVKTTIECKNEYQTTDYKYRADTSAYVKWIYDVSEEEKRNYPYLLSVTTAHNSSFYEDEKLRYTHNLGVKYIGKFKIQSSHSVIWTRKFNEDWKLWTDDYISSTNHHIWLTATFRNPEDYYKINKSIDDRRINVLMDIDAITVKKAISVEGLEILNDKIIYDNSLLTTGVLLTVPVELTAVLVPATDDTVKVYIKQDETGNKEITFGGGVSKGTGATGSWDENDNPILSTAPDSIDSLDFIVVENKLTCTNISYNLPVNLSLLP